MRTTIRVDSDKVREIIHSALIRMDTDIYHNVPVDTTKLTEEIWRDIQNESDY